MEILWKIETYYVDFYRYVVIENDLINRFYNV